MRNKILRPANSKYHYSYLFFYKINNGDSPSMYSCAFWCEYIDLVGVFWLLLFDHYHFPQVRTPLSDLTLVWDLNSYIDRIEYHFLTGWFFFFWMKRSLHFATKPHSRDICVRGTRTQPTICVGCSVHYWVSCTINRGGIFEIAFVVVVDTWGALLRFASIWRANSRGDSCVLGDHLSNVSWGLLFYLRKSFIF